MAVGDANDMLSRLRGLLPPWFPPRGSAPVLDGALTGIANTLAFVYSLIAYACNQTRIATATDAWLDLIAFDFLGPTFVRRQSETDASFRTRIKTFLLMPRVTLAGITAMLLALTGRAPAVINLASAPEGWDIGTFAFDDAGCWAGGALAITAFRPPGQGIPNVDGFDGYSGGFDTGAIEWTDSSAVTGQVTDAEITSMVSQWVAAGVNYTLTISS